MEDQQTESVAQTGQVAPISKLWWVGLLAGVGAGLVNLVYYFITKSLFSIDYIIPIGGPDGPLGPLPIPAIFILSIVPTIGATILLAILARFTSNAFRIFQIVVFLGFLGSFYLPMTLPDTVTGSTAIGLSVMHVIYLVVVLGVFNKLGRE